MAEIIILKNVEKSYKGSPVLSINELVFEPGEIAAIVGKNGSGKSTLIKIISGLLLQDSGSVDVLGVANSSRQIHHIAKFVLESGGGYYQYLSVKQNIEYFLHLNHLSYHACSHEISELFELFEFSEYQDHLVSELSQGNRQKLSLIVAMLYHPRILCLDEPTNGLDAPGKQKLSQVVSAAAKKGMIVLLTTHDAEYIELCATRVIQLSAGKIVLDRKLDTITRSRLRRKFFTIEISNSDLARVEAALAGRQLLESMSIHTHENTTIMSTSHEEAKQLIFETAGVLSLTHKEALANDLKKVFDEPQNPRS